MTSTSIASIGVAAVKASRPKQWVKNGLLFAALIFAGKLGDVSLWILVCTGFVAFSALASCGYLLNDLLDMKADRLHPKKSKRPLASGALPVWAGVIEMLVLLGVGVAAAASVSPFFLGVALVYLVTTLSYSLYFKHRVIVDVLVLSLCYVWRAIAGAVAIDVPVSSWLFLCTAFLALFIGFNKRKAELAHQGASGATRRNLTQYSEALLDQYQATVTGAAVVCYALYTVSGAATPWMVLTMPFVLYGLFRFIYLVERKGMGEAPDETFIQDFPLIMAVLLYLVVVVVILQLHQMDAFPILGAGHQDAP
jgi:4-hydroxybenzoate polyprenyltransferase